jgi:SAM-dependent methyltransferase
MGDAHAIADDAELLSRYRATYGLEDQLELSVEQVNQHLALERRLTAELLSSPASARWDTFTRCYDELYAALPWLAGTGGTDDGDPWQALIGPPPKSVYEVGSGTGRLAQALAGAGYRVEATDIARDRGGSRTETDNLRWSVTDGVHLDRLATAIPYDAVISDQLIEHLHPDDILEHFRSARAILRPGGRYVFRTPQSLTGPHDVSLIFGFEEPVGMHLREYTNAELQAILGEAGYRSVRAVLRVPERSPVAPGLTRASGTYLRYLIATERVLDKLQRPRQAARHLRGPLHPRVWIVATNW